MNLTADVGQKRKNTDSSLDPQREEHSFDYVENEFMLKVKRL
jgi:hypothetical protein